MREDGTAIAGIAHEIRKADPSEQRIRYEFPNSEIHGAYGGFIDAHYLNRAAMADEVSDLRYQKHVSSEVGWATVIDAHLQKSIRESTKEALIKRHSRSQNIDRNYEYGRDSILTYFGIQSAVSHDPITAVLAASLFAFNYGSNLWRDNIINRKIMGESLIEKRRWSLFVESQLDRYLAVNALTRVNSIVKVKK